jgi:DNA-binding NtrC family response regulator
MCAALARLAGTPQDTPAGAPGAPIFDDASPPDAVVLGLAGDLEAELEFAHRMAPRLHGAHWILVGETAELERAHGLFDTLPAVFFTFPPEPSILRAALQAAGGAPELEPLPLSQRPARDTLSERFSRAFADLELPELLHAFDRRLGRLPLLVLGEPGSGRGAVVRYIHQFGPTLGGALVELDCTPETGSEALLERIALVARHDRAGQATGLWLRDAHRLSAAVQREVAGWIEFGLPWGAPRTRLLRWFGTAEVRELQPQLRRALAGLAVTIPPLRERAGLLANLANATAAAWCSAHDLPPRRLGEDVQAVFAEYPWPGNLAELEAVIAQSLAACAADPLAVDDLVLDGAPFVPIPADEIGTLIEEDEAPQAHTHHAPRVQALAEEDREPEGALEELVSEPYRDPRVREEDLPAAEILELPPLPEADDDEPALDAEPELLQPIEELLPDAEVADEAARVSPVEPERESEELILVEDAGTPRAETEPSLQRLAAAVGHEMRNPLSAVRTFTELLPERFDDPDFRNRFSQLAEQSLGRVEDVLSRLERLAAFPTPERRAIDVGALLREVLEKRRATIHERRLLVLEELDRTNPTALCDPEQLRFALESLVDESLRLVPERGDVYLASRRHEAGLRGAPSVRILLRYRGPHAAPGEAAEPADAAALAPAANALSFALADIVVRTQGGSLTLDTSDRNETVLVLDLPS